MKILRSASASLAGLALVAALAPATPAVATAPSGRATTAARVATCAAADLSVVRGRLEGAAGSRFQAVRAINEGDHPCAVAGWTRYRFLSDGHAIGWRSTRNRGYDASKPPVVIDSGATARSVLSWVDPGPVPPGQCHARHATGARVRIAGLPGRYHLHLDAMVCTTRQYRPHGTRLRVR